MTPVAHRKLDISETFRYEVLSEREKLLFHMLSFLTTASVSPDMSKKDVVDLILLVRKDRCRQLSDQEVKEVKDDIEIEFLQSRDMYDERIHDIVVNFENGFKEYL